MVKFRPTVGLSTLLRNCGEIELLSADEERELAAQMRKGNQAARDKLIHAAIAWAATCARKFKGFTLIDPEERESAALEILTRKISLFDPDRGRLSTYVRVIIQREIGRMNLQGDSVIRMPSSFNKSNPTLRENAPKVVSLHAPVEDGELLDFLSAPHDVPEDAGRNEERDLAYRKLRWAVARLKGDQRTVIQKRFLEGLTLEETTAHVRGITRERVRQIQTVALTNLRGLLAKAPDTLPVPAELRQDDSMHERPPAMPTAVPTNHNGIIPRIADCVNAQERPNVFEILENVTLKEIQQERDALQAAFDEARTVYEHRIAALRKLETIVLARDGQVVRKKRKRPELPAEITPVLPTARGSGRKSRTDKITAFLEANGESSVDQIMVGTGIGKQNVLGTLTAYAGRFTKQPNSKWALSQAWARDKSA